MTAHLITLCAPMGLLVLLPTLSLLARERAGKSAERLFHGGGRAEGKNRAVTPTVTTAIISLFRRSGPDLTGRLWRFLGISNFYFAAEQSQRHLGIFF